MATQIVLITKAATMYSSSFVQKYWLQRVFGNIEAPIGHFRITGFYQPNVDNSDMARGPYDGGTSF